jgi:DNA excision repair protein ERCC-2
MVLADRRFQRKRNQLPRWIADEILEGRTGLSTDAAVGMAKKFLRSIAQPLNEAQRMGVMEKAKGKDSWTLQELMRYQAEQRARRGEGHEGREDAQMHDYMESEVNVPNGSRHTNGTNGHTNGTTDEFEDDIDDNELMAMA